LIAEGLIRQAQSDTATALQSALIAAAVALLVAVITQLSLFRRDRRERLYQRRRTALLQVQEAALALRQALAEYGESARAARGVRSAELLAAEREFDRTSGVLEVMLSRVENDEVRDRVNAWRRIAQISFISVQDEASPPDEQQAWATLNDVVGSALRER
jgi:hypothetical protein